MRQSKQDRNLVKNNINAAEILAIKRGFIPSVIDTGSAWVLSVWDSGQLVLESTLLYAGTCTNRILDANGQTANVTTSMPGSAVDLLGWARNYSKPPASLG